MGGTNPYIQKPKVTLPKQKYTIEFRSPDGSKIVEVDPEKIPSCGTGEYGSILDIAMASGIEIDHACGGVCACSTCHVIVREGLSTCNEASEDEEDQLDEAPGLTVQSRLACQTVPNGTQKVVVEVPSWNRNIVKEGH
jgi:ferredoxin, 2Fe-2S